MIPYPQARFKFGGTSGVFWSVGRLDAQAFLDAGEADCDVQTPGGPIAPGREENGQGESGKSGSRFMANRLSGGHEDDDDHGGCQSDEDIRDFLIGKSTRGKVVLDFVSASG